MENIVKLTSQNIDDTLAKSQLLLLDFWAEWCNPCKAFHEVIKRVAPDYPDFTFALIDVEHEKALAEEFQVVSVPMIMILRDRVVVYHDSGALTPTSLQELLDKTKQLDMKSIG